MKYFTFLLFTFLFGINYSSFACTGITVSASDLTIVSARTMEFALDLKSNIIVVPKAYTYKGTAPGMTAGKTWATKYMIIGANALGSDYLSEGMNEKGLSVGAFYHSGYADYQTVNDKEFPNTIGSWEVVSYVLSNFSAVDEAVKGLREVKVANIMVPEWGNSVPPFHYKLQDAGGNCVVIEYLKGSMVVYENVLGVITNNPTFDWHITNLGNYINLSPVNVPQVELGHLTIQQVGQGTGLLGLPGDFTPPSRFVRAVALTQCAFKTATSNEVVNLAFHILNSFDIIKGVVRNKSSDANLYEQTQWVTASDLKNLRFFMKTYNNPKIKMVDLKKVNLSAGDIIIFDMSGDDFFEDITNKQ
jgi:choloylglycine hydrolase